VELLARAEGLVVRKLAPPDRQAMAAVEDLEREVIAVVTGCTQMSGGEEGGVEEPGGVTTRTLRISVSEEVGRFWRALESVHARLWLPGSFVAFLVRAVMKAWAGATEAKVAYADVYLRDRWRCASPVCTSRNVTPHHIRFRSRGGGEERGNLVAVCETCHLELTHGGRLTVDGDAELGLEWRAVGWAAVGAGSVHNQSS
jgi:hypothetical protein